MRDWTVTRSSCQDARIQSSRGPERGDNKGDDDQGGNSQPATGTTFRRASVQAFFLYGGQQFPQARFSGLIPSLHVLPTQLHSRARKVKGSHAKVNLSMNSPLKPSLTCVMWSQSAHWKLHGQIQPPG